MENSKAGNRNETRGNVANLEVVTNSSQVEKMEFLGKKKEEIVGGFGEDLLDLNVEVLQGNLANGFRGFVECEDVA